MNLRIIPLIVLMIGLLILSYSLVKNKFEVLWKSDVQKAYTYLPEYKLQKR
jgi:ATP/ADP translocase